MRARDHRGDPRLNAVASLKQGEEYTDNPADSGGDPRLNAVASLKRVRHRHLRRVVEGDPRLNAVASLKPASSIRWRR